MADLSELRKIISGGAEPVVNEQGNVRSLISGENATLEPRTRTWSEAFSEGFKNLGTNAKEKLHNAYEAVTHPLETGENILNTVAGTMLAAVPPFIPISKGLNPQIEKSNEVLNAFVDKYGSTEGFKEAIATDPIGTALDLSPVLGKGISMAGKGTAMAAKSASKIMPKVYIEKKPSAFQSGGAAATPLAEEMAVELFHAKPELKQAFQNAGPEAVNPTNLKVIKNHNQFEKFGMTPTEGQALEDAALMSEEYNARREDPHIRERYEERDQKLIDSLNNMRDKVGSEAFENNREKLADSVLTTLKNKYEAKSQNAKQLWEIANKAAGESMSPIDIGALQLNIENGLKQAGRTRYLPEALAADLKDAFSKGYLTPQEFENFRSDTATIQRKNPDPFARQAAAIVRDKLENVPIKDEFARYKPLYDEARKATASLKADEAKPFFAAAIADSRTPAQLDEGVLHPASKTFFDKHYGSNTAEPLIDNLIKELGRDSQEHQALNRGAFEDIKERVGLTNDKGIVKQANINNILYSKKGYGNRLPLMFGHEISNDLKDFADVARKTEPIKGRHAVNTSNTAIVAQPRMEAAKEGIKSMAATGAEQVVNAKAGGLPVGTFIRNILKSGKEAEAATALEAEKQALSRKRLSPTAGVKLKDIDKEK
jgi:hypothetical protein